MILLQFMLLHVIKSSYSPYHIKIKNTRNTPEFLFTGCMKVIVCRYRYSSAITYRYGTALEKVPYRPIWSYSNSSLSCAGISFLDRRVIHHSKEHFLNIQMRYCSFPYVLVTGYEGNRKKNRF